MRTWNIPGPIATTTLNQLLVTNQQVLDQTGAVSVTVYATVPWALVYPDGFGGDNTYTSAANKYPANVPIELNHRAGDLWIVANAVGTITASINSVP